MKLDRNTKVKFYFGNYEETVSLAEVAAAANVSENELQYYDSVEELCSWYYKYRFLASIAEGGWSYSND